MRMHPLRAAFVRYSTRLHMAIFRATNGRVAATGMGMPVLMLTTTGRKSGRPYSIMLTSPVQDSDRVVLVASYGGNDKHPAWFLNLRDNPAVEVMMHGRSGPMRARIASQEEKAQLWPRVVEKYSGYAGYQRKTERDIPLVILEPTPIKYP